MSQYQKKLIDALLETMSVEAADEVAIGQALASRLDMFSPDTPQEERAELYDNVMSLVKTAIAEQQFGSNLERIELGLTLLAVVNRGGHLDHA